MKRKYSFLALLVLVAVFLFVGCACNKGNDSDNGTLDDGNGAGGGSGDTHVPVVSVVPQQSIVQIIDTEIADYDYTQLFYLVVDGNLETVEQKYLDLSAVSAYSDSFPVKCTYENQTAQVLVQVNKTTTVTSNVTQLTIYKVFVDGYDFNAHFIVTENGKEIEIKPSMVQSNVAAEEGDYTYTVAYGGSKSTIAVHVTSSRAVTVVPSYRQIALTLDEIATFDYTTLFSLYVELDAVQVTPEMIDTSVLQDAQVGQTYTLNFSYVNGNDHGESSIQVAVVDAPEVRVSARNVETYPNGPFIELSSLFEITKGDQTIPVTNEMVSGTINYSREGNNNIVLSYEGQTYTATVRVRRGVIIDYAAGDTVRILQGTNKATYLFADDFVVTVNGLRFRNIMQFIDVSAVDFDTVGEYTATLSVPYNNGPVSGTGGATFTYVEKTITYKVEDLRYDIDLYQQTVALPSGTTEYDALENVRLTRNNRINVLTSNENAVMNTVCYAQVVSNIDFTSTDAQLVQIDVYVGYFTPGTEKGTPVRVEFYVKIAGSVQITGVERVTFGNETIFTKDLFTITADGRNVPVTNDMVTGKVDTFHAGIYVVTAEYMGATAQSTVVVVNPQIVGTYKTQMTTVAVADDDDEDDYEGYAMTRAAAPQTLGDIVISPNGTITVNDRRAKFVGAQDANTIIVQIGSYNYTVYYLDGILVLDPDNSLKMGFSDSSKRPLVYFKQDVWTINRHFIINSTSQYVLSGTTMAYSIDAFKLTSADGQTQMWYGLKVRLAEKTSSDTIYVVTWGEVGLPADFRPVADDRVTCQFDGQNITFDVLSSSVGKVNTETGERPWANRTFTGTVNGKSAQLVFNSVEGVELRIDNRKIVSLSSYEYANMKNGGINHADSTLHINFHQGENKGMSYKFEINAKTGKFTYVERDAAYGRYCNGDMYIFLDGYGTGVINFNNKASIVTKLTYTLVNNEVKITFVDTLPTFAYGDYMTFTLADLKNVLSAKYSVGGVFDGKTFVNDVMVDGAIVTFSSTMFVAGSFCKTDIINSIKVVTPDGELNATQKQTKGAVIPNRSVVDLTSVGINQAGIYQISVTVLVNGSPVTTYYAVQVFPELPEYQSSQIVAELSQDAVGGNDTIGAAGAIFGGNLCVDKYGRVKFLSDGIKYVGYAVLDEAAGKFAARAYSETGTYVDIEGERIATGIFRVSCHGAVNLLDYYCFGTVTVAGNKEGVLRSIQCGAETIYTYAATETSLGEIVQLQAYGSDYTIVFSSGATPINVHIEWGTDAKIGLTVIE